MPDRILRRVTAAFVAMALTATAIAAAGAQVPASPTRAGRTAPDDVLQLAIGEHSGRIEMLRPRGSNKADQPEWFKPIAAAASQFVPQNGIQYHGGPVMTAPNAVAIYWGNSVIYAGGPAPGTTGPAASDGSLIGYFLTNLGGTPYYNINTTYTDANGTPIPNALTYAGFWANNHNVKSDCANVSDSTIQSEIVWGFNNGKITYDPNTIYTVFGAGKVNLGGGFGNCTLFRSFQYCAYHGSFSWNGQRVMYAVLPYDNAYPGSCTAFQGGSPANGDAGADAEVNTLAHELEEANTDPQLNAWYDSNGSENADKCAWTFGTVNLNGGTANVRIGARNFLVQRNWLNLDGGSCAQAYALVSTTGSIGGRVTNSVTAAAVAGASVSVAGGPSTTSDASGNYTLSGVTPGSASVTASKAGYTSQTDASVTVTAGATATRNFALVSTTGSIGGRVTNSVTAAAVAGASVSVAGGPSTTSDASGNYTLSGVTPGSASVTASKAGYTSQTDASVTVTAGATATRNFALVSTTGSIGGRVTNSVTAAAIAGASVSVAGGPSTTSDASGNYTLSGVTPGSASVTASKAGYTSQTDASVTVTAGATATRNFALVSTTGSIGGRVTNSVTAAAIAGASVSVAGGPSTTSDASGNYTLSGVTPGSASVTASKAGYTSQTDASVTVTAGATATRNFALVSTASVPGPSTLTAATNARTCVFFGLVCSGGGVRLAWSGAASIGSPISQYRIYRNTTPSVDTSGSPYATAASGTTSYTDSSTTRGTTYYYVVVAVNGIGPGADSNVASAAAG